MSFPFIGCIINYLVMHEFGFIILKLPDTCSKIEDCYYRHFTIYYRLMYTNSSEYIVGLYTTGQNCNFKHYYSRTTLKGMCISITALGKTVEFT